MYEMDINNKIISKKHEKMKWNGRAETKCTG